MKTYTEEQVLSAIEHACGQQKAQDYMTAGLLLLVDDAELKGNIEKLLNYLSNTDNNAHKEVELSEILTSNT